MHCPKCNTILRCACKSCKERGKPLRIGEMYEIQLENDLIQCPSCDFTVHMDFYEEQGGYIALEWGLTPLYESHGIKSQEK